MSSRKKEVYMSKTMTKYQLDHFKEKVLLIKTAWGGKSLYKDFRPPSAGDGAPGEYYTKMIQEIRTKQC